MKWKRVKGTQLVKDKVSGELKPVPEITPPSDGLSGACAEIKMPLRENSEHYSRSDYDTCI
jgi:hypothetical protein